MLRIILIALTSMLMSASANALLLGGLLCNTCVIPPAGVITQTQVNAATAFANATFPSSFIRNVDDTVYVCDGTRCLLHKWTGTTWVLRMTNPLPLATDPFGPAGKNYINVKTDSAGGTGGINLLDSAVSNAGSGNFQVHTVGYWEVTIWTHDGVVFQVDSMYKIASMWFTYTPWDPHPGEQVPYSVTPPPGFDA